MISEGVKTDKSDEQVNRKYVQDQLEIGITALDILIRKGRSVKHLRF